MERLKAFLSRLWYGKGYVRPVKQPEMRNDDELQDVIEVINNSNWKAVGESAPFQAVVSSDIARTLYQESAYRERLQDLFNNQVESQRRVNQSADERIMARINQMYQQRQQQRPEAPVAPPEEMPNNEEEISGVEDRLTKMPRKIQAD